MTSKETVIPEHILADVRDLRRHLHTIPELALQEEKTKASLLRYLQTKTDLEVTDDGSGIFAYYNADGNCSNSFPLNSISLDGASETIAFRADFDAVCGKNGQPGHFCGHDGHAAILAGFARYISETKPDKNVLLIFQPAEETGQGALLCRDILKKKNASEIYGFHNIPGFPQGAVLILPGTFACASTGMEITITGTPSHAAYPEAGKNPSEIIAQLILNKPKYLQLVSRSESGSSASQEYKNPESKDQTPKGLVLVTVIGAEIGGASYGVSASKGTLRLTVRAEYEENFRTLVRIITQDAKNMAQAAGMDCEINLIDTFPATENHPACVKRVETAAESKGLQTITPAEPFRWSEDFGYYLQHTPGAFFGIGDGEDWPQLHTQNYEFPDQIEKNVLETFAALL